MNVLLFLISLAISLTVFYLVKTYLLRVSVPLVWLGLCFVWGILFWPLRMWLAPELETSQSFTMIALPILEPLLKVIPLIYLVSSRKITSYRQGILYGLAVGLSFSYVLNFEFVLESDLPAVEQLLRMASLENVHAISTGMMGFALSMGRSRRTLLDKFSPLIGVVIAAVWQLAFTNLSSSVPEGRLFIVGLIFAVGGAATIITVVKTSQLAIEKKRAGDLLDVVIPIGVELSSEKEFGRLLERMTIEAITYCQADAGILYLRTDDDKLKPVTLRYDRLGIALGGTTGKPIPLDPIPLNEDGRPANQQFAAAYTAAHNQPLILQNNGKSGYDFSTIGLEGFRPTSCLVLPLETSQDSVIGVLQLFDARDEETDVVIPFDDNLEAMMRSFSSLATVALEGYLREASLRQEYAQLSISIDGSKVKEEVRQIEDSDFFRDLQARAKQLRRDNAARE